MKRYFIYPLILFSCTWLCILVSRYTGFGGFIREQIEGYLVDYSISSSLIEISDEGDPSYLNKDQLLLKSLRQNPQDSIVIVLLSDSLQNRRSIIRVIEKLMQASPAVVGVDILFDDLKDSMEFIPILSQLTTQYSNLVLAYSLPNEADENTIYPLGASNYNDFPNLGYTNFGLKGKEVRYLDAYTKIDGQIRPAFWTLLWSIGHPDISNGKLRSHRRFINYNFGINDLQVFEVGKVEALNEPYPEGTISPSPLESINGKMVLVGWRGENDFQIVPVNDGVHLMYGIDVIGIALNTIVFNERSHSLIDIYRDIIATFVLLALCILFAFACETTFYNRWSNVIQLLLGLALFLVAPFIPLSKDEVWTVFGMIVVFILIAPALDDLYKYIKEKKNNLKAN